MVKFRSISIDKFNGAMTPEEHAIMVSELLNKQSFSSKEHFEICPSIQERNLCKLRDMVRQLRLQRVDSSYQPIHVGDVVTTRHKKVAPLGPVRIWRQSRKTISGNVIEESQYFPGFWLVYWFTEKKYYYVSTKFLKYSSSATVTNVFKKKPKQGKTVLETVEQFKKSDEDLILLCVLNSKIHRTVGYKGISMDTIIDLFLTQFPFITKNRIQKFVKKYRTSDLVEKPSCTSSKKKSPAKCKTPKKSPTSVIFASPESSLIAEKTNRNQSKYVYAIVPLLKIVIIIQ